MRRLLFILAFGLLLPAAAEAQTRYTTTAVRLRTEASTAGSPVATMPRGAAVEVRSCDHAGGTWCAITYNGRDGYAAERYLSTRRVTASRRQSGSSSGSSASGGSRRSSAEARGYYTGPRGGCYTYSASGRKRYVDRSYCN